MCKPTDVTDDQVKLCLVGFPLICCAKDWIQCIPNGTIHTWKELEDKFLERYLSDVQFMERKVEICEVDLSSDAWQRFKLLLQRCPNHNMSVMEHMTHFIGGVKTPTRILLNVSVEGTLRNKNEEEVKTWIENMFQNKYRSSD